MSTYENIKFFFYIVFLFILACLAVGVYLFGSTAIKVCFVDNVPVKCFVDGKLVYSGISAGIDVESSGYSTTVKIKGGFLYLFPEKYYVSKDVFLRGAK